MARRKIAEFPTRLQGVVVIVQWNPEYREYRAAFRIQGRGHEPSAYYTEDKQDALKTAQVMASDYRAVMLVGDRT